MEAANIKTNYWLDQVLHELLRGERLVAQSGLLIQERNSVPSSLSLGVECAGLNGNRHVNVKKWGALKCSAIIEEVHKEN